MAFPPTDKSLEGLLKDYGVRTTRLERQMARSLPDRLGPLGEEVLDWNDATLPGFYWSETAALNNPSSNIAVGIVMIKPSGINPRVMQIVYFPSAVSAAVLHREWRRTLNIETGEWTEWRLIDLNTDAVAGAPFVAAAGWTLAANTGLIKNGIVFARLTATRTGAAITVAADGNITDTSVATFATGWEPMPGNLHPVTAVSLVYTAYLDSANIRITSVNQGRTSIAVNDSVTFSTTYPLA